MRANLIPMQLRGPQPKGMWQIAGRFAFSSGVNLREGTEGGREGWKEKGKDGRREGGMDVGNGGLYLSGSNFSSSVQYSGL